MDIIITTKSGTTKATKLIPSVSWSGDYQQAARSLNYSILSSPTDKDIPVIDCPLGAMSQLYENGELLFEGYIVSRTKNTDSSRIDISCFDRGFVLKRNKVFEKFTNQTPEAITAYMAGKYGFSTGKLASTGIALSRNFITGKDSIHDVIATAYTEASKTTGKKYHIGFRGANLFVTEKGKNERTIVIKGKSNLIAASTSESIENTVCAVQIFDPDGKLLRTIEDAERLREFPRLQEIVIQSHKDDKTADAKKILADNGVSQKITVDSLGNIANITGGSVVVQEPYTGLYGLFYIDGDTHEWKRGQYYNKLVLNYDSIMSEKEAGSLPNASGKSTAATSGSENEWQYIPDKR